MRSEKYNKEETHFVIDMSAKNGNMRIFKENLVKDYHNAKKKKMITAITSTQITSCGYLILDQQLRKNL